MILNNEGVALLERPIINTCFQLRTKYDNHVVQNLLSKSLIFNTRSKQTIRINVQIMFAFFLIDTYHLECSVAFNLHIFPGRITFHSYSSRTD